jgi:aminoglycoside phosphotransferase (APT) family kinase protein
MRVRNILHTYTLPYSIIGTPFYVMEYVRGEIYKSPMLPELTVDERRRMYANAIDTLVRVHSVDTAKLQDYGKTGETWRHLVHHPHLAQVIRTYDAILHAG